MARKVQTRPIRNGNMPRLIKCYGYNKVEAIEKNNASMLYKYYLKMATRFLMANSANDKEATAYMGSTLRSLELKMKKHYIDKLPSERKFLFNIMCINMNVIMYQCNANKTLNDS